MRRPVIVMCAALSTCLALTGCAGRAGTDQTGPASIPLSNAVAEVRYANVDVFTTDGETQLHLQAVEQGTGSTVYEAVGSDAYDAASEIGEVRWTTGRQALLVQLCFAMEALGWSEVGTGPEWYAIRFSGDADSRTATLEPDPSPPSSVEPPSEPEPAPSTAAPGVVADDLDALVALIGRPFDDPAVAQLVRTCGAGPDHHASGNVACVDRGFELTLTSELAVQSLTLFNYEYDGYQQYGGTLPFGLSWESSYGDILDVLGAPEQVLGGNGVEVQLAYTVDSTSATITMTARHQTDADLAGAGIHWIQLANSDQYDQESTEEEWTEEEWSEGDGNDTGPTAAAPEPIYTDRATITTWYTDAAADHSAWVHFKAVDEAGYTVAEVTGSDLLDLEAEAAAMDQTPERVALVDELRSTMRDQGWTELGVQGDWYQFAYGR